MMELMRRFSVGLASLPFVALLHCATSEPSGSGNPNGVGSDPPAGSVDASKGSGDAGEDKQNDSGDAAEPRFVPAFFAAPVVEFPGAGYVFVSTEAGPVLLFGSAGGAASTAERAVATAAALNALVNNAQSKPPAFATTWGRQAALPRRNSGASSITSTPGGRKRAVRPCGVNTVTSTPASARARV